MKNLLTFEDFLRMEAVNENAGIYAKYDEEFINEDFSSRIMSSLVIGDTKRKNELERSGLKLRKFQADLVKAYNVDIAKIKDEDFTILNDPSVIFKKPYIDDKKYMCFCVNDDPEIMSKARTKVPILVAIVIGGKVVFEGFNTEKGSWQPSDWVYGEISKRSSQYSYFGIDNAFNSNVAIINPKRIKMSSTKVYALDMEEVQEKYDITQKNAEREVNKYIRQHQKPRQMQWDNALRYKNELNKRRNPPISQR